MSVPVALRDNDRLVFGDQELLFRQTAQSGAACPASETDSRNAPTTALHTNKLTTILVVDIRDFTSMARSMPESLLSQTLGTWFLKTGHAVMAAWVHDDPEREREEVLAVCGRRRRSTPRRRRSARSWRCRRPCAWEPG